MYVDDPVRVVDHALRQRGEQVDAERLVGELAYAAHLVVELLRRHRGRTECAEAAGVGHRGDDALVGDAAHSGEHDGVLDAEHPRESCVHPASVH